MWKRPRMPNVSAEIQAEANFHSTHEEEARNYNFARCEAKLCQFSKQTLSVSTPKLLNTYLTRSDLPKALRTKEDNNCLRNV